MMKCQEPWYRTALELMASGYLVLCYIGVKSFVVTIDNSNQDFQEFMVCSSSGVGDIPEDNCAEVEAWRQSL